MRQLHDTIWKAFMTFSGSLAGHKPMLCALDCDHSRVSGLPVVALPRGDYHLARMSSAGVETGRQQQVERVDLFSQAETAEQQQGQH